jgi:uncharacterized protein with LGFP repeats
VSRRAVLKIATAAPIALGLNAASQGFGAGRALADGARSAAAPVLGQPVSIINRAGWGADERLRRGGPVYDDAVLAGVVHHSATGNDYAPKDSAAIVRSIYVYHTRDLGWGDIAYNALVDRYGQVFEGRFGGIANPVLGSHTGGFNTDTWAVCMIGNFDKEAPPPAQLRAVGQLLGWRLAVGGVNPKAATVLRSAGGPDTRFPAGATPTLPTIFAHRDVGQTECPGNVGYAFLGEIRDIAARFNQPPDAQDVSELLRGGAIDARWRSLGGKSGPLGPPLSPEATGDGSARYVVFARGAVYWSPPTGAQAVSGAIYDAWATLGYERGRLGLPTSGEVQEPEWIVQNFQHGTLNVDRQTGQVTRVMDGIAAAVPAPPPGGPPVQLERFSPARDRTV